MPIAYGTQHLICTLSSRGSRLGSSGIDRNETRWCFSCFHLWDRSRYRLINPLGSHVNVLSTKINKGPRFWLGIRYFSTWVYGGFIRARKFHFYFFVFYMFWGTRIWQGNTSHVSLGTLLRHTTTRGTYFRQNPRKPVLMCSCSSYCQQTQEMLTLSRKTHLPSIFTGYVELLYLHVFSSFAVECKPYSRWIVSLGTTKQPNKAYLLQLVYLHWPSRRTVLTFYD